MITKPQWDHLIAVRCLSVRKTNYYCLRHLQLNHQHNKYIDRLMRCRFSFQLCFSHHSIEWGRSKKKQWTFFYSLFFFKCNLIESVNFLPASETNIKISSSFNTLLSAWKIYIPCFFSLFIFLHFPFLCSSFASQLWFQFIETQLFFHSFNFDRR